MRIADTDGNPDTDFPKINGTQKIGQIGATSLALCFETEALIPKKQASGKLHVEPETLSTTNG